MKFTREIQGGNTYLVYQIQPEEQIDTLSLGMIVNNKIEGIAPVIYNQMDNRKFLKYNISSKVSLEQFFTGTVNRQRLLCVIDSILEGITAAEDYMLESKMLLLFPSYIFVDVSTGKAVLICVPTLDMCEESIDPGTFFKAIMFNTRFDQSENGDYIAKIISYLNSTAEISVEDFKQLVKGLLQETEKTLTPEASQTQFLNKIPVAPVYTSNQMEKTSGIQQTATAGAAASPQNEMPAKASLDVSVEVPAGAVSSGQQPAPDMGFAIPGGAKMAQPDGKKEKKKKDKKEKKQKETVVKEKPPKEKKGFSLFGRKKKEQDKDMGSPQEPGGLVSQDISIPSAVPTPGVPSVPGVSSVPAPGISSVPANAATASSVPPQRVVNIKEYQTPYTEARIPAAGIGETTVLGNGASGETVVLSGAAPGGKSNPRLTRVRNKQQIIIDKPVFRIGKERSYVDYFIGDNPAISRSHANIVIQQNGYYIEDTNSTNHTYVNDKMIVSGSAVKLEQGARIRLGNEEFIFQY